MARGDQPSVNRAAGVVSLRADLAGPRKPVAGGRSGRPDIRDRQYGDRCAPCGGRTDQVGRPGRETGRGAAAGGIRCREAIVRSPAGADYRTPAGKFRGRLFAYLYGDPDADRQVPGGRFRLSDALEPERAAPDRRGFRDGRAAEPVLDRTAGIPAFRIPDGEKRGRADRQRRHSGRGSGAR